MYRVIQVALDGSAFAEQALPFAIRLAQRNRATLEIVRVHEPLAGVYVEAPGTHQWALDRELMEQGHEYLRAIVERLKKVADFPVSSMLLKGPIAESIAAQAATSGADLLVMTTHARGPVGRFWFGSIADALVRQSPVPLLMVPPQSTAPDMSQPVALRHLLIPLDGSELAEQAIEPALALAGENHAEYTLLRVVTPIIVLPTDPTSGRISGVNVSLLRELDELHRRQLDEATDYLDQVANRLRARSFSVTTQVLVDGRPANAVMESVSKFAAEAIAMTTRGRGGLKRLLLGSIADKVLRGATTPVLMCPPVELPKTTGENG